MVNKPLYWIPLEQGILPEIEQHIGSMVFITLEVLSKRTVVLGRFKGRDTNRNWIFGKPTDNTNYLGKPLAIMPIPEPFIS